MRIPSVFMAASAAFLLVSCSRQEEPKAAEAEPLRQAVMMTTTTTQPAEVAIGAGGSTKRVATVSGAKARLDEAAEDASSKLVDTTNMAVKAKMYSIGEASAQGSTEYQGVRIGVYGQNDYYLAETSFITNYVGEVVTGTVDDMNEAVLYEFLKRQTLSDCYMMGTMQFDIADYTAEVDVDVRKAHVGLETQIPLGVHHLHDGQNLLTDRYFRVTNTLTTVTPPFTCYGRWCLKTDPEFLSKPNLFFLPYTNGVYTIRIVDMHPPASAYDSVTNHPESLFVEVTVSKSTNETIRTITIPPRPPADSISHYEYYQPQNSWIRVLNEVERPAYAQDSEMVHWYYDVSTMSWYPTYKVGDDYLIISSNLWVELTGGTGEMPDEYDEDAGALSVGDNGVSRGAFTKEQLNKRRAAQLRRILSEKVEKIDDDHTKITTTYSDGDSKKVEESTFYGGHWGVTDGGQSK